MPMVLRIPFSSYALVLLLVFSLAGCNKENGVPAYVAVNDVTVETDYLKEGSPSDNIHDVWFYAAGDELGVYELPAEVPVLKDGQTNLVMFAGIKRSGQTATRVPYPFYDAYSHDTFLIRENTLVERPVVKYRPNVAFPWLEHFEDLSFSFDSVAGSELGVSRISDPDLVLEGKGCAGVILTPEADYFIGASTDAFKLPLFGNDVYLEIDYRTNLPFQILVRSYNADLVSYLSPVMVASPKTDDNGTVIWNKLYVYLTPVVSAQQNSVSHRVYIETTSNGGNGYLYLDNLKVVHFE
ncbi:hypothetical protein KFE98_12205 [bacterium SCSIO 12741]|nr:hypothetical protein KFE98_12205 [bacterium SCSIO 12741]